MGTISKVNDILCANISKIDDVLKANAAKFDDNIFCPVTPTPTPTPGGSATPTPTVTFTPTVTPTVTPTIPCTPGCCFVELCYDPDGCRQACPCNIIRPVYLSIPCKTDPCLLSNATGIFNDDLCSDPAPEGYYSDGTDCYSWFSGVLTYDAPCA